MLKAERILGWIAGSPTSARAVSAGVVEHSIYVDPACQGRGVGRALLTAFVDSTEAAGIWTLQRRIFPENAASLAVHRPRDFAWSACGSGSAGRVRAGATSYSWSGGAGSPASEA